MTASQGDRDALIDAMAKALDKFAWHGAEWYRQKTANILLDALLADPVRLLKLIAAQTVPCPTCWGRAGELTPPAKCKNPACEGGDVPVDVLSALTEAGVIEQVGWRHDSPIPPGDVRLVFGTPDEHATEPVFVAARRGGTS